MWFRTEAATPSSGVVVRLPLGDAGPHRQDRLGTLRSLAIRLLSSTPTAFLPGQVRADDVGDVDPSSETVENLKPSARLQAEPSPYPGEPVVADGDLRVLRGQSASRLADQYVTPGFSSWVLLVPGHANTCGQRETTV